MSHPHDAVEPVPDRLDAAEVRELSKLSPVRALAAIVVEWATIAAAISLSLALAWWPVTALAVIVIGARQHALTVISHDAAHFRLLPNRTWNDWIANIFLAWPMFISVQGFRHFHGAHHRHLGEEGDGNRALWHTHDTHGAPTAEWRYPKTAVDLAFKVLRRAAVITGAYWIVRGVVGGFMFGATPIAHVVRVALWAAVLAAIAMHDAWLELAIYWLLPYCTWHVAAQYLRLVCEHSVVEADDPRYAKTRSTIPGPFARFFVLPRNIGYHIEHHWYPSVPLYNLPTLHARLMERAEFRAHAQCSHALLDSLWQCVDRPPIATPLPSCHSGSER